MKLCTRPVVLTLSFSWPFCQVTKKNLEFSHIVACMNGSNFVDTIAHWTVWHWPSIMVSTVSKDDVVVHKTYCFDLDHFLMVWKVTNNFDSFHFVQWMLYWMSGDLTPSELPCYFLFSNLYFIFWRTTHFCEVCDFIWVGIILHKSNIITSPIWMYMGDTMV